MADRKATFAKRQRESELKDRARAKEARRAERKSQPRTAKGPEIAWDELVTYTESPLEGSLSTDPAPTDDAPSTAPTPAPPAPAPAPASVPKR